MFNETTNYNEVNLTFDNDIINNNNIAFFIKEKSYKNYYMSVVWSRTDKYSNIYNEVMSLHVNYNFETNSCMSLFNQEKSNELSSLIIGQNSTSNEKGIYCIIF